MELSDATKEVIYLRTLLDETGLEGMTDIVLHNDNRIALILAKNRNYHGRSMNIHIKHHFIRDAPKEEVTPEPVPI